MNTPPTSRVASFGQTEINWDKLDKRRFYVVGAGLFTGVTVALYPVSVVKTRLQVASREIAEKSAFSVVKGILKNDGVPGLYRGFGTVITGAVPARIIFLTALETTKISAFKLVAPFELSEPTQAAIANGIAGMTASLFSQAVFVPIDVVSQKLMVQGYSGHAKYTGGIDVATKIIKSYGVRGLYRGFGLSVMTYSPSSAAWWASYGSSQRVIWRFLGYGADSDATAAPSKSKIVLVQAAGGIIAGATASSITTPLDTIKTRLQVMGHQENRPSAKQVVKNLIAEDGWKGFYRGLGPRFFSTVSRYDETYKKLDKLDFVTATKILFTEPSKNNKFGFDWHVVQFIIVCLPSLAVYLVAQYARRKMKIMDTELGEKKRKEKEKKDKEEAEQKSLEEEAATKSHKELMDMKQRLGKIEETIKEIVLETKKPSRNAQTKTQDDQSTKLPPKEDSKPGKKHKGNVQNPADGPR